MRVKLIRNETYIETQEQSDLADGFDVDFHVVLYEISVKFMRLVPLDFCVCI